MEGEQVILQCQISWKSPVTRIIFCKDGVQVHSLKAQQGQGNYVTFFPMARENAGTFTCGYQQKDNSNRVRNSALSAPTNLRVTGSGSSSQAGTFTDDITPTCLQTNYRDIMIGLVVISLLLLAATTYSFVRKGACRERCQRQQQVPSHEAKVTEDNEIQSGQAGAEQQHRIRPGEALPQPAPVAPARRVPRDNRPRRPLLSGTAPALGKWGWGVQLGLAWAWLCWPRAGSWEPWGCSCSCSSDHGLHLSLPTPTPTHHGTVGFSGLPAAPSGFVPVPRTLPCASPLARVHQLLWGIARAWLGRATPPHKAWPGQHGYTQPLPPHQKCILDDLNQICVCDLHVYLQCLMDQYTQNLSHILYTDTLS
ncbi:uncharacterized protein LOC116437154 isoform X2 [Corvus moneduloides]|uniref:uncharacterized protein LOC116437154 isoform X2 n=1 Tax=Corvus moneduloides TaxID=1196302 RepID=UPI0013629157|nr:uncharacterized protein LOC116437154 isoform X2 [Corvus moneduloides]